MSQKKEDNGSPRPVHLPDRSALFVVLGVILLFSTAIGVVLIAPRHIDSTWVSPSSSFQVQMYEGLDPNFYISSAATGGKELHYVNHLKQNETLLLFKETEKERIVAPKELEKYITPYQKGENRLKLTTRLLLLRAPEGEMLGRAEEMKNKLKEELIGYPWKEGAAAGDSKDEQALRKPDEKRLLISDWTVLELYDPQLQEAFSIDPTGGILPDWVDDNFEIVDGEKSSSGVIYVHNPREFRYTLHNDQKAGRWSYDPKGASVRSVEELIQSDLGFLSRKELIAKGEEIYAIEGCWYCHTDQTRTLIEDLVLNGSESFPAPPSTANEFIYQKVTFPGTRRIGPDLSRVGVKRPSRDWHLVHFLAPNVAIPGTLMPAFRHFFDSDPSVAKKKWTDKNDISLFIGAEESALVPNIRFEAIYQYLMTKGTRITSPTRAWWLGEDPVRTKEIINGEKR